MIIRTEFDVNQKEEKRKLIFHGFNWLCVMRLMCASNYLVSRKFPRVNEKKKEIKSKEFD